VAETVDTNSFKNGMHIELDSKVWRIVEFQHVKPGKGGAFVRTKLKSLDAGAVVDRTFRAGEKFPRVHTETKNVQYLYDDGSDVHFMDAETYEAVRAAARRPCRRAAVHAAERIGAGAERERKAVEPATPVVRRAQGRGDGAGHPRATRSRTRRSRRSSRLVLSSTCRSSSTSATGSRWTPAKGDISRGHSPRDI